MASVVLKCALLAVLMVSVVIAQRRKVQPLYPEGHPPPQRPDEYRPQGKAGHCPPPLGERPIRSRRTCSADGHCPNLQKCCNTNGRNYCVEPVFA